MDVSEHLIVKDHLKERAKTNATRQSWRYTLHNCVCVWDRSLSLTPAVLYPFWGHCCHGNITLTSNRHHGNRSQGPLLASHQRPIETDTHTNTQCILYTAGVTGSVLNPNEQSTASTVSCLLRAHLNWYGWFVIHISQSCCQPFRCF